MLAELDCLKKYVLIRWRGHLEQERIAAAVMNSENIGWQHTHISPGCTFLLGNCANDKKRLPKLHSTM